MPYFNSFRKTYTSVFDIKADVALTVYGEMDIAHIKEKFDKADMLYIGGGDTKFMLEHWKKSGLYDLVIDAYERGVIIAGLSAGAICWFKDMYSDYDLMRNQACGEYKILDGIGAIDGACSPHYNERVVDYLDAFKNKGLTFGYGIENDCALEFTDGKLTNVISSGGKAYYIKNVDGEVVTRKS